MSGQSYNRRPCTRPPHMISQQTTEEILRFVDQIVPPGATGVWLCGSRAKGSARPDSDWDVTAFHPAASPDPKDAFLSNQIKDRSQRHCRCFGIWRSLSMTPYLAALDRRRHHRHHRRRPDQAKPTSSSVASTARPPSSPRTGITKMESATSSAAAAPPRRPEQVGLRQSSLNRRCPTASHTVACIRPWAKSCWSRTFSGLTMVPNGKYAHSLLGRQPDESTSIASVSVTVPRFVRIIRISSLARHLLIERIVSHHRSALRCPDGNITNDITYPIYRPGSMDCVGQKSLGFSLARRQQ